MVIKRGDGWHAGINDVLVQVSPTARGLVMSAVDRSEAVW